MSRYLVGFDIGTQGSKAIITDTKGNIIAKNQKKLLYKCFSYLNARISR